MPKGIKGPSYKALYEALRAEATENKEQAETLILINDRLREEIDKLKAEVKDLQTKVDRQDDVNWASTRE